MALLPFEQRIGIQDGWLTCHRFRVPRRRPVAAAVIGRAKMRAALDHLARDFDCGLAGM